VLLLQLDHVGDILLLLPAADAATAKLLLADQPQLGRKRRPQTFCLLRTCRAVVEAPAPVHCNIRCWSHDIALLARR
jgi:hypothetical protein